MDVKAWKATDPNLPKFPTKYEVKAVQDLSCTDIKGNNNKYYHLEIQVAGKQARVHSEYGRVGAKNPAKEYRYADEDDCQKIFDSIIKSKTQRKSEPYVKIDLAKRDVGSTSAQKITKPVGNVTGGTKPAPAAKSKLEPEVQRIVSDFFNATSQFVQTNLKCPLGQLSREQIDQGRSVLDEAKALVNAGQKVAGKTRSQLEELTSKFYSLIPHNFGFKKLDAEALLLSDLVKIAMKESDLDVFLDAKNASGALEAGVDDKYGTLKAELVPVEKKDPVFKWLDGMVHATRAANHKFLGKITVKSIFKLARSGEGDRTSSVFLENAERIAKECGKYNAPHVKKVDDRPDVDGKLAKLYQDANVWPVFHGTRNANMVGIITRGLLIRPAGAVHAGSMFGDGIYFAHQSTKALNYSSVKGSYWASGKDEAGFMFVADAAFGNLHVAERSHFYHGPPKGYHSVYGKAGTTSGLINDEMITYYPTGPKQQHALRYVLEIETDR
ncbi:MAG TPA: WGR domain-containing protein [Kofleriaceae bacterium]|nr:WGR domain-containing protein [Kofleriaceae bacterium]